MQNLAPILMYHRVAEPSTDPWGLSVSPARFAEHLDVLRRRAQPARLSELANGGLDRDATSPAVAITFDDGYGDNLWSARPLLERADVPATVFAVSGMIGENREFWWDELDAQLLQPGTLPDRLDLSVNGKWYSWELGEAAVYSAAEWRRHCNWCYTDAPPPSRRHSLCVEIRRLLRPLSAGARREILDELSAWSGSPARARPGYHPLAAEELLDLADGGLVEVGAHTVTHALLPAHPETEQANEVEGAKRRLEDLLQRPVTGFAYPYGLYDAGTMATVRRAGFEYACAARPKRANLFELPRVKVRDWNGDEFERHLSCWFDRVAP